MTVLLLLSLVIFALAGCSDAATDTETGAVLTDTDKSPETTDTEKAADTNEQTDTAKNTVTTNTPETSSKPEYDDTRLFHLTDEKYEIEYSSGEVYVRARKTANNDNVYEGYIGEANVWRAFTFDLLQKEVFVYSAYTYRNISHIEAAFGEKVLRLGFSDGAIDKGDPSEIQKVESNVQYLYYASPFFLKGFPSINGLIYSGSELIAVPSGLEGEVRVRYGTTKINADAFAYTKLSKVYLPDTVTEYKEAFASHPELTVRFYSWMPTKLEETYMNGIHIMAEQKDGKIFGTLYDVPFVIEGGHLTGDIELRLVSVIEYALRLKVTSMTFETERCIDEYSWAPSVYVHIERYDIKQSDKYISIDGVIFTSDKKTLVLFPEGRTGEYTIPDHVLTVSEDAFANSNLTKLVYKKELDGFAVDTRVEQVRK